MSTALPENIESRAWHHVRELCQTIGPRPSTRKGERDAADYCCAAMQAAEIQNVRCETFGSGRSAYLPFGLAIAAGLVGNLWQLSRPGRASSLASLLLNGAGALGFWREANFQNNWMRRVLPKGQSQNVIGVVPAREETLKRVVLVGHIDSHRTPLVYSSPRWLKAFSTLVGLAFIALPVCGAAAGWKVLRDEKKLRGLHFLSTIFEAGVLLLIAQAETSSFAPGAHDNASGAATVLALGERLAKSPLGNTEVWIVNDGCEEVGAYGIAALLDAHGEELRDALFLNFDMCGIGAPGILTREGLLKSYFPDQELLELARRVAAKNPALEAREHRGAAYTDMGVVAARGFKGLTIDFVLPENHSAHEFMGYWHQTRDTIENLDPAALEKTHRFGWALLQEIDANSTP